MDRMKEMTRFQVKCLQILAHVDTPGSRGCALAVQSTSINSVRGPFTGDVCRLQTVLLAPLSRELRKDDRRDELRPPKMLGRPLGVLAGMLGRPLGLLVRPVT
mmetsp:Transcript_14569/g.40037  ORF Transcript_14569/g.40037 Transcript_14569/m.40037 type:complete len:103 (+) Transcript_14569:1985-2293(+)